MLSSQSLLKYFKHNFNDRYRYWSILVRDGKFSFDGRVATLDVVTKSDFIETVDYKSMERLHKFLSMIEDQPITLGFDNRWVFIKEAIL